MTVKSRVVVWVQRVLSTSVVYPPDRGARWARRPPPRERIRLHITGLGKDKSSKFQVRILPKAYHFHIIVKLISLTIASRIIFTGKPAAQNLETKLLSFATELFFLLDSAASHEVPCLPQPPLKWGNLFTFQQPMFLATGDGAGGVPQVFSDRQNRRLSSIAQILFSDNYPPKSATLKTNVIHKLKICLFFSIICIYVCESYGFICLLRIQELKNKCFPKYQDHNAKTI